MSLSPPVGAPLARPRNLWFWPIRIGLGLIAALLLVAILGPAYQTIATARDQLAYPPPGKMIAANGIRMHILCTGDAAPGFPTVILEAGTGLASPSWTLVAAKIAPTTRVCAYDRAGNGWSAPGPLPRDAATIAGDLHALLAAAAIAPPYVLAGHSFGGIYSRVYADAYPGDVVGLVLVDSTHPDQLTRSPSRNAAVAGLRTVLRVAPFLAHFGIVRATGLGASEALDMPAKQQGQMTAFGAQPSQAQTMLAELSEFPANAERLSKARSLGALPLFVLSAGKGADADWPALQDELAALSTNSVHHTIADTDHTDLLFTAAGAGTTAGAILAVAEAARTHSALVQ